MTIDNSEKYTPQQMHDMTSLWVKAQPVVTAYISSTIIDYHLAEDILQQVAYTAATKFDEFDRSRSFTGWVIGITKFKLLHYYAKHKKDSLIYNAQTLENIAEAFERVEPEIGHMTDALHTCIGKTTGKSRKAIELRYVDECSSDEIADKLEMKSTAVRVLLHRTRHALADCIKRQIMITGGLS